MATIGQHWYVANASRDYPVDERASCCTDDSQRLPTDILLDLRLRWPVCLGKYGFLSAVAVTPNVVTLLFQAATSLGSDAVFAPIASLSLLQPQLRVRRQYPLSPQYPGVGGYVVLGDGCARPFFGRFKTPQQSFLTQRAAAAYEGLPVTSLGRLYADSALTGLVLLKGRPPVEIVRENRMIDGRLRDAVVLRLVDSGESTTNVLSQFVGPCGRRPESRTCQDPQPVEQINGVGPDCDGEISLVFTNTVAVGSNIDDDSIVVDYDISLADTCVPPKLPDAHGLLPSETASVSQLPPPLAMEMSPVAATDDEIADEIVVLRKLPYSADFTTGLPDDFVTTAGTFSASPAGVSPSPQAFAVWRGCEAAVPLYRATLELSLDLQAANKHDAALLLEHRPSGSSTAGLSLRVDADRNLFLLEQQQGKSTKTLAAIPFTFQPHRYRVTGETRQRSGHDYLQVSLLDLDSLQELKLAPVELQLAAAGHCGFGGSGACFHCFTFDSFEA